MGKPIYVPGSGNPKAKLLVLGEAPGKYEEEHKPPTPLVGPSGRINDEFLENAGMYRSEVFACNVVPYRCPGSKIKNLHLLGHTIDDFIPEMWRIIDTIRPNAILALGNIALQASAGKDKILNWRGSILPSLHGTPPKVIPTIHPAAFLYGDEGKSPGGLITFKDRITVQLDYKRAVEESKTPEYNIPKRVLTIARSAEDVLNFLLQYKGLKRCVFDVETLYGIAICVGLAFNSTHALSIPLISPDKIGKGIPIPTEEILHIWEILEAFFADETMEFVGQNIKFDRQKLLRPYSFNIHKTYFDTMLAAHTIHCEFPKKLAYLTSIYTREPFYKDEGYEFDYRKDKTDDLLYYNGKDVVVEYEIMEKLEHQMDVIEKKISWPGWKRDFYYNFILPAHEMYIRLENNGILIDQIKRKELKEKYAKLWKEKQEELNILAGHEINVKSNGATGQVSKFLQRIGFPPRNSVDEDTLAALLANHAKRENQVKGITLVLDIRAYRGILSKELGRIPDFDGRMRTSIRETGTETGRTSNSDLDPPLRPFDKMGIGFQTLPTRGIGSDIREMFIADPGWIFLKVDQSQAEARVTFHLAGDTEMLVLLDTPGFDIHRLTASWFYGIAPEEINEAQRFVGKTGRFTGERGGGKRRLMETIVMMSRKYGINIVVSEWKAGKILDTFHEKSPKIRGVYYKDIERLIATQRYLVSPSGRFRMFYDREGDKLLRDALSQLPQSTVHDQTMKAMVRIESRIPWIKFVKEDHDAFFALIPEDKLEEAKRVSKEEMEAPIDFSKCSIPRGPLVIPCGMEVGTNYGKLEKCK